MKDVIRSPEDVLKAFQCDHIRMIEETFAQTLAEREDIRLFFINENEAFTDGKNIVVDPAILGLYADEGALLRTVKFLGWPRTVMENPWNALSIITRALTIHECLHILYTDFPCRSFSDPVCDTKNKRRVMSFISNIIEDAYIEAAGCSCFDNMEFYLTFIRVAQLFHSGQKQKKVVNLKEALASGNEVVVPEKKERTNADRLRDYLSAMIRFLLYPWIWNEDYNRDIAGYIRETRQFYADGSIADSPAERYAYCGKIFTVIQELIPEDEEELDFGDPEKILIGGKTHNSEGGIAGNAKNWGRAQRVNKRLFAEIDGRKRKTVVPNVQITKILEDIARNRHAAGEIAAEEGVFLVVPVNDTGAAPIHKGIKISENHPKINYNLRKAYKNIHMKYATSIRSYNTKFEQLLRAHVMTREEGFAFGSGITSNRLGDPHKRYWYRKQIQTDVPDMAVLLLIDGSGSMRGARIKSAMESAVILHEVLQQQGITHAVVEHRAHFTEPEIEVNVLVDFGGKDDQKLNLMRLKADGDNRDGLALFWAEKYIGRMTQNEYRLILVLSDGVPAHDADDYYPPVSVKDTANAVKKIKKKGTDIIAVSLDDEGEFECYDMLSEIYPNLIACNDLARLTGQLLGVIAKLIK